MARRSKKTRRRLPTRTERFLYKHFGHLFVIRLYNRPYSTPSYSITGQYNWDTMAICRCSCGAEIHIVAETLTQSRNPTRSCGCINRRTSGQPNVEHEQNAETPEEIRFLT